MDIKELLPKDTEGRLRIIQEDRLHWLMLLQVLSQSYIVS